MSHMLDLSSLIAAAEVLKLAAGLSGDAQYILSEHIRRCERAPFVRVAGDLAVEGHLRLDWDAPPWDSAKVCGLVVEGDLSVGGSLTNSDLGSGPVLLVLGNVRADRIVQAGAAWLIRGDVRLRRTFFGVYNDGYAYIGGDLSAEAILNQDHALTVAGRVVGHQIDEQSGHAWLTDGVIDPDGEVDWDALTERAAHDQPLTRAVPVAIDIRKAAEDPDDELLAMALAAGADLEQRDGFGNTPLLLAVLAGRQANAERLIAAGADMAAVNENGEGAAHLVCFSEIPAFMVQVLDAGPPLDSRDHKGRTPMVRALEYRNLECVRALHARGIALPTADPANEGYPYSLYLAERSHEDLLAFLVEQGADLDWTSSDFMSDGYTLLHEAAWRGSVRSVDLLLHAKLAVDARDARGRTPLRALLDAAPRILSDQPGLAAAIAQRLLEAGADPLATADDGRDSVDAALHSNDGEVLRIVNAAATARAPLAPERSAAVAHALAAAGRQ